MFTTWMSRSFALSALLSALVVPLDSAKPPAPEINPAAVSIQTPGQIHWIDLGGGELMATIVGNPAGPGLYVQLVRWTAHHMGAPHFHPNDRYITVLSGTWWLGTGTSYDPNTTVPVKAGSFVTYYGNQFHYDGAKDEDAVLEIVGMGPATSPLSAPVPDLSPAEIR